jgi:hypothetical protein
MRLTASAVASNVSLAKDLLPNDASSDDMSSTSEDAAVTDVALSAADSGKPLSFARIASLNLEKQQVRLCNLFLLTKHFRILHLITCLLFWHSLSMCIISKLSFENIFLSQCLPHFIQKLTKFIKINIMYFA